MRLKIDELHKKFIDSLPVLKSSDINVKPFELDIGHPCCLRVRLYIYNLTHPPGGRTVGEHKVQLIIPGQKRGERANFDDSDGRIPVLVGYESELDVFVIWDAGLYPNFSYSRNVQVNAETVYAAAFSDEVVTQCRDLHSGEREIVVLSKGKRIKEALLLRNKLIIQRLLS